jgi:hypothetical protein
MLARIDEAVLRYFILVVALLLGPGRRAVALGGDADTVVNAKTQGGAQEGRRAHQACQCTGQPPGPKAHGRGSVTGI